MGFLKMYLIITGINVIGAVAILLVGALLLERVQRKRLRLEETLRGAAAAAVKDALISLTRAQAEREAGASGG